MTKRDWKLIYVLGVLFLWMMVLVTEAYVLSSLVVFLGIWLYPRGNQKILINRFKDYRNYILRIVLSVFFFIFIFVPSLSVDIDQILTDTHPSPQIKVTSNTEHQGDLLSYKLEFQASDVDTVFVNGKVISGEGGLYSLNLDLANPNTQIVIKAENERKETVKKITVERDKTEAELEEEKIAEEERKRIEAEKKAEKEAAQKEWEQSKAGRLCKRYPQWSRMDCKRIADGKIWIGMSLDMLKERRGDPESANPSNYGSGTQWQFCWHDYTPSCFYDKNGDGLMDSYN